MHVSKIILSCTAIALSSNLIAQSTAINMPTSLSGLKVAQSVLSGTGDYRHGAGQIFFANLSANKMQSWSHDNPKPSTVNYSYKVIDQPKGIAEIIGWHPDNKHNLKGVKYRLIMHFCSNTLGTFKTTVLTGGKGTSSGTFLVLGKHIF